MTETPGKLRIDKWLWQARFFKTRSLAAKVVGDGHVRLNGVRIVKPSQGVGPGDVLTFAQAREVRVVRVEALGQRRGPASEAQALYSDLAPPEPPGDAPTEAAGPRPTKRDRRLMDQLRRDAPD